MEHIAIKMNNVSKKYKLGQRGYRSLREDISRFFHKRINRKRDSIDHYLWALKDISFEVKEGEAIGIIGPNGAGKSTILKLLAHVTSPTAGGIIANGRIGALIELSGGFHPELTGRENIYLYSSIIGMKKKEINRKFDEIVNFSELGEFINTPIKRYSSGMLARLGFSASIHINPDILLIDEVLSVGDFSFQNKCLSKMQEYKNNNTSIVFVSHNLDSVRKLCDRTIFIHNGQILFDGHTEGAIDKYYKTISESQQYKQYGANTVEIIDKHLLNSSGEETVSFQPGEKAIFQFKVTCNSTIDNMEFGFFIRSSDGLVVYDTTTDLLGIERRCYKKGKIVTVQFLFTINLLRGFYNIGCHVMGIANHGSLDYLAYVNNIISFSVTEKISHQGIANLDVKYIIE